MIDKEREEKLDALRRFEQARREHLGGAVNLVFGLSVAAAGFCLSRIADQDSNSTRPGSYYFVLATVIFIITVGICISSICTRLCDFQLTARKLRGELRGTNSTKVQRLGDTADCLGKWTWRLFYAQLATFAIGVAVLAVAISLLYFKNVFPQ